MKIDIRQPILDYQGEPITESQPDPEDAKKVIQIPKPLREYFSTALNNAVPNETMTGDDKTKAYEISTKLFAHNEPNLTSEQITFLKDRILKVFINPLVCGRLIDILEQNDEREKPLPADSKETDDEALGVKNADLTNVVAKDASKPPIQPNKKADGRRVEKNSRGGS
jgi:hypothetical protein